MNTAWETMETPVRNYRTRLATFLPAIQIGYFVLLWPLVYARGIVTADLATGPMPETQSFLLNRLFFPALAGISLLLLVAERRRLARFHLSGAVLLAALAGWLCLTALWALAPSVTVSKLLLLAMQIVSLLPAVLLARNADEIFRPLFIVMAVTLVVNTAAVAVIPATPLGHAGIYSHKNTLGAIATLCGLFAFYGLLRRNGRVRITGLLMLPVVLLLLYLSRSKTSLALFLICPFFAFAAVFIRRYLRIALPVMIIVAAIPAVFLLRGGLPGFAAEDLSEVVSGDGTFTGRTDLWSFADAAIAIRPLQGYGYQSFWGIGPPSPVAQLPDGFLRRAPHAHNGYLDVILQGGAVLLVLVVMLLLLSARWMDRLVDHDIGLGFFTTVMLLYLLVLNTLETVWLQSLSAPATLAMLLILMAAVTRERRALI